MKSGVYEVTFDIQPLADKLNISKEKCAKLLADEFMRAIGLLNDDTNVTRRNSF